MTRPTVKIAVRFWATRRRGQFENRRRCAAQSRKLLATAMAVPTAAFCPLRWAFAVAPPTAFSCHPFVAVSPIYLSVCLLFALLLPTFPSSAVCPSAVRPIFPPKFSRIFRIKKKLSELNYFESRKSKILFAQQLVLFQK